MRQKEESLLVLVQNTVKEENVVPVQKLWHEYFSASKTVSKKAYQ